MFDKEHEKNYHQVIIIKEKAVRTLLDLDGEIIVLEADYWVKFSAQAVPANAHRPHGVNYALTFHAPDGARLIGYDNAHPVKLGRKKIGYDHRHRGARTYAYQWVDAEQLLIDFWADVEAFLNKELKQ